MIVAERPHARSETLRPAAARRGRASPRRANSRGRRGGPSGLCGHAGARGDRRGGRPRVQSQLAQDARDVAVHGVLAHDEPFGDLPVREPLGEQASTSRSRAVRSGSATGARRARRRRSQPARPSAGRAPSAARAARAAVASARAGSDRPSASSVAASARGGAESARRLGACRARRGPCAPVPRARARARARVSRLCRDTAQAAVGELRGGQRIAALERQPCAAQPCARRLARGAEQPGGLVGGTLASAQVRQPDERAAGVGGPRAGELPGGAFELLRGRVPAAAPQIDGAVVRAAEAAHVAAVVALGELRDPVAPLERPREVAHLDAGGDQQAERPGGRDREADVAARARRPSPRRGAPCRRRRPGRRRARGPRARARAPRRPPRRAGALSRPRSLPARVPSPLRRRRAPGSRGGTRASRARAAARAARAAAARAAASPTRPRRRHGSRARRTRARSPSAPRPRRRRARGGRDTRVRAPRTPCRRRRATRPLS